MGWGSVGGLRGTQAWGPCSKQHTPTGRPAPGGPAPRPETPTTTSLGPETSGEEAHTGHRLLRSRRKGPWSCTAPPPRNQPLAPEATLQSHEKSPRTCHLLSPRKGAGSGPRGPQPWPTTVMSLPLFPDGSLLEGFSRITHPTPTPFLLSP